MYYTAKVTLTHKKEKGQFFTPLPIAQLMSSFSDKDSSNLKILDPGLGTGILSCALLEHYVKHYPEIKTIELIAYETDTELIQYAQTSLSYLKNWIKNNSTIEFKYILHVTDFILDNAEVLSQKNPKECFDIIISNPPYFKLSKNDNRALAANRLVNGQPNIYSIFMGIAAKLLSNKGELIFITPRSFASGNYFKAFRELFFDSVRL